MDLYTRFTRSWLERRYKQVTPDTGVYFAHEPIYGVFNPNSEPNHVHRLIRLFQILRAVRNAGGKTLLDVGGSEGYMAELCRRLFGIETVTVDLSVQACRRAAEIFGIPGCGVDAAALPFADDSFDLVISAEVIEHLADPVPSILEMQRVAKQTTIIATEEWLKSSETREQILAERKVHPHTERSVYADADLRPLFHPYPVTVERQIISDPTFYDNQAPTIDEIREYLLKVAAGNDVKTQGIIATIRKQNDGNGDLPKTASDSQIIDALLETAVPLHTLPSEIKPIKWPDGLQLQCPESGNKLPSPTSDTALLCSNGADGKDYSYPMIDGVLDFMPADLANRNQRISQLLESRNRYDDQVADLIELANKLEMGFKPQTHWSFKNKEHRANFEANSHLKDSGDGNYRVTDCDPHLSSGWLCVETGRLESIDIEYSISETTSPAETIAHGEIFWLLDGDDGYSPEASASFTPIVDGKLHTYSIELPSDVRKEDRLLTRLRIDPTVGPCEISINNITLVIEEVT